MSSDQVKTRHGSTQHNNINHRSNINNKRIASSDASLPKGNRRSRGLREELESGTVLGTTLRSMQQPNETDFMGSVTMSPASGRQKGTYNIPVPYELFDSVQHVQNITTAAKFKPFITRVNFGS